MLKTLNVKSKVLFALLSVTFITAAVVGSVAVWLGITTLREESFKKLTAVRELKANQIENYFHTINAQIRNYSKENEVAYAMDFFKGPDPHSPGQIYTCPIHKTFKNYVKSFGLMDLYLVDAESGEVMYSSGQGINPGISLKDPLYANSNMAIAFRKVVPAKNADFAFQTDYQHLWPSPEVLSSFVAAPVYTGQIETGVLLFQISIDRINEIITDGQNWGNKGLGETGETYLAGEDHLIRNQSRFIVEDSADYFKKIILAGIPPATITRLRLMNSAIGLQPVSSGETQAALKGETGIGIFRDYRGVAVLGAYKPLIINDLNWVIVSKIDQNEVMRAIRVLFGKFLLYISILFVAVIIFSIVFARDFSRPVEALAIANEQLNTQSAAMKSAANGIIITDVKGIVNWVNPAFTRLTGYDFSEIVGNNLKVLNSGVQSREFFLEMWSRILAGEVWHDEVVNKRKDGTLYTEEMTITPVRDSQGRISQFVAIKHDITERKRLEQILKRANERMEDELNVARDIQMSMLPLRFPAFPERDDIDVYAKLIPAREVGGDFYDFFFIDEENFCFVVGDVSGKGVPGALFMAVTKALLKAGATNERSTARILTRVNNEISRENENSMFITVFMAILNTTTGHLVYSNAGHNPSFILTKNDGGILKLSDLHGVVIGAMEGIEYRETLLQLNRGDAIFAYTDGVTEAQNNSGELYSEKRLVTLLNNYGFTDCKDLVHHVVTDVIIYENGAEHADDITLLTVQYREQTPEAIVDSLFITIANQVENIGIVIEKFELFAEKHSVPLDAIQKVNIVFDELLNNTISYAYRDNLKHEIEIKIRYYTGILTITLMDDGIPYNPFDRLGPDTTLGIEEREIGGLGVHLVKLLVDDYNYEYKDQIKKNITSFKKII